jgi:uncharacterized membrane protein YjgN (DUF898 family)
MENRNDLRVSFTGQGGELFVLWIKNLFLTIITLGVYSFWAKVNLKRYFYEHTSVAGGRFGWHATGKERFIAFLKGMGVMVALYIVVWVLAKISSYLLILLPIAIIVVLPALAVASLRYKFSRTSYNQIRFRFTGRPGKFALVYLKGILLTGITFGIYLPWFTAEMQQYMNRNTAVGNSTFDFDGKGGELFIIYLKGFFLTVITFGIYLSWFMAELQNYMVSHTKFQGKNLIGDLKGGDLFIVNLVGYLLTVITLGIYLPWWIVKSMKVSYNGIALAQAPDMSQMQAQFDAGANPLADGLADAANFLDTIADFLT